jgi:hypothetical protein
MTRIDQRRLRRYIVRIDHPVDDRILGTGFFVAPGFLLTAAHVVHGLSRVVVRPADPAVGRTALAARVAAASTSSPEGAGRGLWPYPDVAVLCLEEEADHPCALLDQSLPAGDVVCQSWGFSQRERGAEPVGEPAAFDFTGVDGNGYLQLSGLARPGLSGAPLLCPTRGAVVGVVIGAWSTNPPVSWAAPMVALFDGVDVPADLATAGREIAWLNRLAVADDRRGWDHLVSGRKTPPMPREAYLHQAYRLGVRFGELALYEGGPIGGDPGQPSPELEHRIAIGKRACEYLGKSLSLPLPGASHRGTTRAEVIVSRIARARELGTVLSEAFGAEVTGGFRLGFELGLAWGMVPFLDEGARAAWTTQIAELTARAGLPTEVADRVTSLFGATTDQQSVLRASTELDEQITRRRFERLEPGDPWLAGAHAAVWAFTRNAALAAMVLANGHETAAAAFARKARTFGDDLGVVPPPVFTRTGVVPDDDAAALHYLLKELPGPLIGPLSDRYGPRIPDLVKLCSRLWSLLIVYHPEDDLGQAVAVIIEKTSGALGLPHKTHGPLVDALRARLDVERVRDLVLRFDREVGELLAKTKEQPEVKGT